MTHDKNTNAILYTEGFEAGSYLQDYYKDVTEDEVHVLKFLADFFRVYRGKFASMLEVGCGPTIHHVLSAAPWITDIRMCDYVTSNLDLVQRWKEGTLEHDWTPYIQEALKHENLKTDFEMVRDRSDLLKQRITDIFRIDILDTEMINKMEKHPLVGSFFCVENVSTDKNDWKKGMGNLASLVLPKGTLITSCLHDADSYSIKGKEFPMARITLSDMRAVYEANGFNCSARVYKNASTDHHGFDSIIIAFGQKI